MNMKKKMMPILVATVFAIVVAIIATCSVLVKKYTPSNEHVVLSDYYKIKAEDEMAIILNHQQLEQKAKFLDGYAYLDYEVVKNNLNGRFYWDAYENIMRYTTNKDVISVNAGSKEYNINKEKQTQNYTIVRIDGSMMYIALDFIQQYTDIDFKVYEEPNRVLITSDWAEVSHAQIRKKTQIRLKGGIKSPIIADLEKGAAVVLLEQGEEWSKVSTEDGYIGYVRNKRMATFVPKQEARIPSYEEPEFTHLRKDEAISLAWHQVTNQEGNETVSQKLQNAKGVNVISPTWFYLNDNDGNIANLASTSYVNYCHQNGVEVWALISNLENSDVDTLAVLSHTSKRDYLTNQIIAAAIEYNLDGINLDFESLKAEAGDSFIQFVRELSIKCDNNNLVFSIDNYVPMEYTAFYNRKEQALYADYIIIMAYDEHYRGSEEGPVASIGFVRGGVENTLKEVPAEQIILGMPFYTRIWELEPKGTDEDDEELATPDNLPYTVSCTEVGMQTAENTFKENGAEVNWSTDAGQYYTEYEKNGKTYKIWWEEETSIEEKCKIMKEHALAGAAYWKIGLERTSVWDTIIKYVN
ncbi:glycosyl hydrolase family 18 protein [Lachnospiraceae bacterium ZAX-1]